MTREYARAPRGERAHGTVPRNAGTVTTMIGALDLWGVRAMMTVEGATDAEVFETFVERVLAKKLRQGDIVVLDNVGAHRTERVRELIRAAGASVLYLPPYSPDMNPIELCWSKLKGLLRELGARTRRPRRCDPARHGPHRPPRRRWLVQALRLSGRVICAVTILHILAAGSSA